MLSLLVPLLLFGLLLFLNRQRARLRLPSAESWSKTAFETAVERLEAAAAVFAEPSPAIEIASVAAGPSVRGERSARYLLDGGDPAPRPVDRVATLQQRMRGRGICSPR